MRKFLKELGMGTAGLAMLSVTPWLSSCSTENVKPRAIAENDVIRLAVVGVNSRGKSIASNICRMPLCEIVAICDCDTTALKRCQEAVANITGKTPDGETDYRKLLERNDIDAVMIAMPDHWHAPAAIMALQAGKHVYLEKPTSYCPEENEMLLKAEEKAKKAGLVITVGTQRRSWPKLVEGLNRVRKGELGEVHYAKSWYTADRGPIGKGKVVPVPENLNWDYWQGPAPRVAEYKDNIVHYNWHWFWHWGTGEALNNGTHFVDLLRYGMNLDNEYPTLVTSVGGRYNYVGQDDWQTPDTQLITYQFGNHATISWEGRSCQTTPCEGSGHGVAFYGTNATLITSGANEYTIVDLKGRVLEEVKSDLVFQSGDRSSPSQQLDQFHFQNWFDAIKKGTPLNAPLKQGCISTTCMQLGNIAQRVGRSLNIDPKTGHIIGDREAEKFWAREYEKGWEIKI